MEVLSRLRGRDSEVAIASASSRILETERNLQCRAYADLRRRFIVMTPKPIERRIIALGSGTAEVKEIRRSPAAVALAVVVGRARVFARNLKP